MRISQAHLGRMAKALADKHGLHCWTNAESFDRDMPIKFLPIKWEKLLLKLHGAGLVTALVQVFLDQPHDKGATLAVEIGKRLVHQPQRHVRKQHSGKRNATLLPRRQ